jgi:hypothetical protein
MPRYSIGVDKTTKDIDYTEEHVHNKERWFGISADQAGNDWALQDTLNPFTATSGGA